MADTKISNLTALTTADPTDVLPIVDTSVTTTKKIAFSDLEASLTVANLIGGTATGTGDIVRASSPTLVTPALGTPSALVGTNITGTAAGLTAGTVTTNANLTGDVTSVGNATTIANGAVDIAMLSATGTPSSSTYYRGDNTWATISAGGDVSKVGTPVNNQMAVWTGDGTLEGTSDFTYDGTNLNLITGKNLQIAGITVLADSAGTTTLSGIDAIDATTEATIEGSIDTLANLTSIQGKTVTLVDAGADALFGWDDSANVYQNLSGADAIVALGVTATATELNYVDGVTSSIQTQLDNSKKRTIGFSALTPTTGQQGSYVVFPVAGTITGYKIVADTGTATIKTWRVASGTSAPTVSNVISTSGVSLSSGTAIISSTVTDFTSTTVSANDIFAFDLTAVSGATKLLFELEITIN